MEKICVAVRVRPSSANEELVNGFNWKVESNRISLHRSHGTPISGVSFAFDHVFEQNCSNATVYELLTKDIIHAAVDGFNGTAFAYGQTSSGKTFTMNGSENDPGIIHRAVKDVFAKIQMTPDREFLIRVSYMEIYNEDLIDLFTVDDQKLQVHESLERGVFVEGLKEEIVSSADQVLNLIQLGEVNRHFGETNMNARSSRSHTVFRMVIESKRKDSNSSNDFSSDDVLRVSVLNLVDLAGSERIAKTGAGGVRLKEGKHINKSLMVLGNVINKLSEGGKQRAHIPYRDSKLTRILQPALGGNAKTSIICTVAPEEVHIEETKGTLLFASRAKRITNCVQVNEILTDAALLKRQKQEIELLRQKLEGSDAEVLKQEVLKLRSDLLKNEFEREKLAAELEEERRSQKECDQLIKEQQMKIGNSSNLVTLSDSSRSSSRNGDKESQDVSIKSHRMCQEDAFSTPLFKAGSNVFVAKRPQYSTELENSPFPDAFSDFADEDTWMQMNKGYIADLDSLHMTPARKVQSFPPIEDFSMENNNHGNQNLNRQLKHVLEERDELKRKYDQLVAFSNQLTTEISELQQEMLRIQEIPQSLLTNLTNCKSIYKDVISGIENFIPDKKSASAQILSTTSEVGECLFSTLESHLSVALDGKKTFPVIEDSIREQCNKLCKSLNSTISELEDDDSNHSIKTKSRISNIIKGEEISSWKDALESEVEKVNQKYNEVEKESNINKQLLAVSESKYQNLERELRVLKEERDTLNKKIFSSSEMLDKINGEKEKALKDMSLEAQKRKNLEDEIKQFSIAFACRQRSIMSFHSDFKSIIETMKAHYPTTLPKSLGS